MLLCLLPDSDLVRCCFTCELWQRVGGVCFMLCRWEAHIWVKELGRQVYLGGYEHEEHAAEAYDVAALKCKGFRVKTNFDADRYAQHSFTARSVLHGCYS